MKSDLFLSVFTLIEDMWFDTETIKFECTNKYFVKSANQVECQRKMQQEKEKELEIF